MADDMVADGAGIGVAGVGRVALIRSAFWVGRPRDEDAFRRAFEGDLLPKLRRLPGVMGADALWPQRREDDPPAIHCQVLVYYADAAGLERMLASPERAAMREGVRALAREFDGAISHIDYRVA